MQGWWELRWRWTESGHTAAVSVQGMCYVSRPSTVFWWGGDPRSLRVVLDSPLVPDAVYTTPGTPSGSADH